ncbi:uncharacterized protein AB675_1326 [Cyphellophora attinorum]|uniref:Uncharacterized protein n=1 Tax=Cyphellophora attinorum TaxID=1664694 RepID=A0A0N1NVY8_9EURO|nr:uncharacterized protein AB675_1326 [Phialophora attinorum]KPI35102.1 hypothetical protein AB675_1326 [Phialophora attinorum]
MAASQMDAVTSFTHLVDNIPQWLEQIKALSAHTKDKNAEFVAEYARLVRAIKPKRMKSPSMCSIHSSKSKAAQARDADSAKDADTPATELIDPLAAGNRHLYADQTAAQRKRKSNASMRSGASGPQRFRSKHQVVIYYDGYVQEELDTMCKAVGIGRNNLRKGKNALVANRGFRLPSLSKKYDNLTSPSLENIRSMSAKYRNAAPGAKFSLRQNAQQPQDGDEAAFIECDKALEQVQNLLETAAHQFLRDGDCLKELSSAEARLTAIQDLVKATVDSLQKKADQQAAAEEAERATADTSRSQSVSDRDCPSLLTDKSSMEPLNAPTVIQDKPSELAALTQTLEGIKSRHPAAIASDPGGVPTAGMTIEVDDSSSTSSIAEIDISQFRSANRLRMKR